MSRSPDLVVRGGPQALLDQAAPPSPTTARTFLSGRPSLTPTHRESPHHLPPCASGSSFWACSSRESFSAPPTPTNIHRPRRSRHRHIVRSRLINWWMEIGVSRALQPFAPGKSGVRAFFSPVIRSTLRAASSRASAGRPVARSPFSSPRVSDVHPGWGSRWQSCPAPRDRHRMWMILGR